MKQTKHAKTLRQASTSKGIFGLVYKEYNYERLLREVHPDFCRRLVARAPGLTPMEVTTCMLARLHLPTKEAARILETSLSTIEMHRSKAREKLGIDRSQNLTVMLHAI